MIFMMNLFRALFFFTTWNEGRPLALMINYFKINSIQVFVYLLHGLLLSIQKLLSTYSIILQVI